jgi:hypothetical protein
MSTAARETLPPTLSTLLAQEDVTQPELAAHLDVLDAETRVRQIRALTGAEQKRLWEVCQGAPAFTLEDLVPESTPEGETVIFAGKNSLAAFSVFEKRFARVGNQVIGYNFQSMSWLTGPGLLTCRSAPSQPNELLFDYTEVPSSVPAGWPAPRSNDSGFSRFVYKNLHDFNRRVSRDVTIGLATRLGRSIDSYFVLARA